jgi:hypothetical protein
LETNAAMRILPLLTGMIIGGGTMIWFYTAGGQISVAGRELGPAPKTESVGAGPSAGRGESKAPAAKPRVVIRDITEGSAPSSVEPPPTSNPPPSAGASPLIVIKWPYGDYVTKFP